MARTTRFSQFLNFLFIFNCTPSVLFTTLMIFCLFVFNSMGYPALEVHFPEEFSSNPDQNHLSVVFYLSWRAKLCRKVDLEGQSLEPLF